MELKYKRRLLKLADVIEVVPPKMYDQNRHSRDLTVPRCAAAYAADVPAFKKAGLKAPYPGALQAANKFFGIEGGHGLNLFRMTSRRRTPKREAALIRKFVKNN